MNSWPEHAHSSADRSADTVAGERLAEDYAAQRSALWEKPCPFCRIIEGDAPATVIERGESHVAFVPIGPHVPGHVLFVPLTHVPDATVNPQVAATVFAEAARYAADLDSAANIITSIGSAATQSVPHLHIHVVPRGPLDGLTPRWPWVAARVEQACAGERVQCQWTTGFHVERRFCPVAAGEGALREGALRAAKAEALRGAADDLESRMQSFPMYGRNTRAGWAVGMLRILADRAALTDTAGDPS